MKLDTWKLALAWGCLVIFFAFPVAMPTIQVLTGLKPQFANEFKYLGEYMRVVATVIVSLAGFSTVELFKKP